MRRTESRSFGATSVGVVILWVFSLSILVPGPALATGLNRTRVSASDLNIALPKRDAAPRHQSGAIVGVASFYDDPGNTASGEPYDPNAFTAAVHFSIRNKFGGIRYGTNYRPAYGIAEYGGKKLVLKLNDVGPLRRGRKFDLSRAAMAYFGGLDQGLLANFKVTRLPIGPSYLTGPLEDRSPSNKPSFAVLQNAEGTCTRDTVIAGLSLMILPGMPAEKRDAATADEEENGARKRRDALSPTTGNSAI
jgi:rare lipoprotein A